MTNIISQLLFITQLTNTKLARGSEARVKSQRCTTLALLEDHNKISPLIAGASLWAFSSECLHFENVCIFYFFCLWESFPPAHVDTSTTDATAIITHSLFRSLYGKYVDYDNV